MPGTSGRGGTGPSREASFGSRPVVVCTALRAVIRHEWSLMPSVSSALWQLDDRDDTLWQLEASASIGRVRSGAFGLILATG